VRLAVNAALLAATMIGSAHAATITVREPDPDGVVFVDVVGAIEDEDVKTFKEKTDRIDPASVIVSLASPGGKLTGLRIGELIREKGLATFVPDNSECTSVCAFIWLAGTRRAVGGDNVRIGFHGAYLPGGEVTGPGNAIIGAYLAKLGLGAAAIVGMTEALPKDMIWLDHRRAKEWGVTWQLVPWPRTTSDPKRAAMPVPTAPATRWARVS
jgi:hypothetical protein